VRHEAFELSGGSISPEKGQRATRSARFSSLYPFEDGGEKSVKNIARTVRVYALRSEAIADIDRCSLSSTHPGKVQPKAGGAAARINRAASPTLRSHQSAGHEILSWRSAQPLRADSMIYSLSRVDDPLRLWDIGRRFLTGPEGPRDCWLGRRRCCLSRLLAFWWYRDLLLLLDPISGSPGIIPHRFSSLDLFAERLRTMLQSEGFW
jgi:hypothetical protein